MSAVEPTPARPDASGSALPQLLKAEVCNIVANQSVTILPPVLAAQALIVVNAYHHVPLTALAAWFGAIAVVHLTRITVLRRVLSDRKRKPEQRLKIAMLISLASGVTHASSVLFLPYLNTLQQSFQYMVLLGLCAGSIAVNVGHIGIVLAFLGPIVTTISGFWIWESLATRSGWQPAGIALLTLFYGSSLLFLARDTYRTFAQSVAIRLEKAELARRLETALHVAQAASRAKTRFLASASHDLRQPLHTLSFLSAALELRPLDPKGRDILGQMAHALEDLSSEFDMLLDVSKLDAGVVPVSRTSFEIGAFLARICHPFAALSEARGLRFDASWPVGLHVCTDRLLLERVVRNLLDNAFKYTPSGSILVEARARAEQCAISIADTGIGIAPSEHARVFEEFYQIDNPERDRRRGLGLGLPIVRRLCDLLGISIEMTSAPGKGTAFELVLARGSPLAPAQEAAVQPQPALRGLQVLVIDDEADARMAMHGYLEALGCQVSLAATVGEAAALAQTHDCDLVIADFRLRGTETGLQAIEALRRAHPDVPALLITGDTAPDKLAVMKDSGIPVLHKPVAPAALIESISRLVGVAEDSAR